MDETPPAGPHDEGMATEAAIALAHANYMNARKAMREARMRYEGAQTAVAKAAKTYYDLVPPREPEKAVPPDPPAPEWAPWHAPGNLAAVALVAVFGVGVWTAARWIWAGVHWLLHAM